MDQHKLHNTLTHHPFFSDFAENHINVLEACARDGVYQAGDWLLREREAADAFYLILSGDVTLSSHTPPRGNNTIQTLHAGDILGWSWLFEPYEWHFDAKAINDVAAVVFDAKAVRIAADADHELGYHLMKQFASIMLSRLQLARRQLLDIYG